MSRRIRFNAFDMNCVAHQSPGLWRHPEDQSHRYKDLDYWIELAKLLEQGRFDGIFIADVLGTYDVYDVAALRQGAQIPVADPLLLVSAMAAVTEHLGFGITTGTGFEHPPDNHRGANYRLGAPGSTALSDSEVRPSVATV